MHHYSLWKRDYSTSHLASMKRSDMSGVQRVSNLFTDYWKGRSAKMSGSWISIVMSHFTLNSRGDHHNSAAMLCWLNCQQIHNFIFVILKRVVFASFIKFVLVLRCWISSCFCKIQKISKKRHIKAQICFLGGYIGPDSKMKWEQPI